MDSLKSPRIVVVETSGTVVITRYSWTVQYHVFSW